jgi:site-specific recombinase XerD
MATVKVIIRKDKQKVDGTYPIVVRVSHRNKLKYVSVGESATKMQWNESRGEVNGKHPHCMSVNRKIHIVYAYVRSKVDESVVNRVPLTFDNLNPQKVDNTRDFFLYAEAKMERHKSNNQGGTYKRIKTVVKKFRDFTGEKLDVVGVDSRLVTAYIKHLRGSEHNNSENTVFSNIKVLKSIYQEAIKGIAVNENPFDGIVVRQTVPRKPKLNQMEISALAAVQLTPKQQMWRDLFLFSFYCWGMRFRDILFLSPRNIEGNVLSYLTSKSRFTKRITLNLNEYSLGVINRYGGGAGNKLFPLLTENIEDPVKLENKIASLNVIANRSVKVAAIRANIGNNISFHTARHSFVDIMKQGGIPIEVRMQMVGHSSESIHRRYHDDFESEYLSNAVNGVLGVQSQLLSKDL